MSYRSHSDLGGRDDSRAVVPEAERELFHAAWEPRVLAMSLAMGASGLWNIDMAPRRAGNARRLRRTQLLRDLTGRSRKNFAATKRRDGRTTDRAPAPAGRGRRGGGPRARHSILASRFTWSDWAHTLAAHIERARAAGEEDSADRYYVQRLQALETLVAAKGAASREELAAHAVVVAHR